MKGMRRIVEFEMKGFSSHDPTIYYVQYPHTKTPWPNIMTNENMLSFSLSNEDNQRQREHNNLFKLKQYIIFHVKT